jgi:hypothetical protein
MNFHKMKVENKIKDLKSKKVDANETECSFKPQLTEKAKKMGKRTVDNLYARKILNLGLETQERRRNQ